MRKADREAAALRAQREELMEHLRWARDTKQEWYAWVADGMPTLTEAQYARVGVHRQGRGQRKGEAR